MPFNCTSIPKNPSLGVYSYTGLIACLSRVPEPVLEGPATIELVVYQKVKRWYFFCEPFFQHALFLYFQCSLGHPVVVILKIFPVRF